MSFLRLLVWFLCSAGLGTYAAITFEPQETEALKLALMFFSVYMLEYIHQNTEKKGES